MKTSTTPGAGPPSAIRIYVTLLDTFGVGTSNLALGLVLLLAADAMRGGRFTIGDFTLFASYVGSRDLQLPLSSAGCWPGSARPTWR